MSAPHPTVVHPIPPCQVSDIKALPVQTSSSPTTRTCQCEILPTGSRYTSAGNFKAGTFLPFIQPAFIEELYPRLPSTEDEDGSGLPVIFSMFNTEAKIATLEEDWEGKWLSIVARLFPNKLTFQGVGFSGWETDESQSVQVALALPRDDGLTPSVVLTRPLSGQPLRHMYPLPALSTWKSLAGWMRTAANPFSKGLWIACSARLLGVLDRDLIRRPQLVDSSVRILVVLPDNWEFIRQNSLSTNNTPTSKSSNLVDKSPTTPRPAGRGGVASRNPFSSPNRALKTAERETTALAASPGAAVASITANPAPMSAVPSSDDDSSNDGSDTEQLLEAQIASSSGTPTKKRKEPSSPEPVRSKRSTAGRKKARLYD